MNSNYTSEKTNFKTTFLTGLLALLLILPLQALFAQAYRTKAGSTAISWKSISAWEVQKVNGDWRDANNGDGYPGSASTVLITRQINIPALSTTQTTTNFYCKNLTLDGSVAELNIAPGQNLTVSENFVINSPATASDSMVVNVGQGNLNIGLLLSLGNDPSGSAVGKTVIRVRSNGKLSVAGNIWNNSPNSPAPCSIVLLGTSTLEVGDGLALGSNFTGIFLTNSIVRFKGLSKQTLPSLANFGNLHIANPDGVGLSGPLTTSNLKGNLVVESGVLEDKGYSITGNSNKRLEVKDFATLKLSYSDVSNYHAFPDGFASGNIELEPASTVIFNGNGKQRIAGLTYGNLELLGGSGKVKELMSDALANNTKVAADLNLEFGSLNIGSSTLTLTTAGSIQKFNNARYIILDGSGKMVVENMGQNLGNRSTEVTFPIGTTKNYTPAYLLNKGATYNFSVGVVDGVVDYYNSNTPILQDGVNKTWNIECIGQVPGPTTNPDVDLRLQWNGQVDELANFSRTNCYVTHYTSNAWTNSDIFQDATKNGMSASMKNVTSFSPFSVADAPNPLPVELTFFKATRKENAVLLNWETASEKNCVGYDILASADGKNFEAVGYMASKNGNATYAQQYEFLDKTSRIGLVYYRLKQTDLDGTVTYYATKVVDMGRFNESLVAFPNPFQNRFELKLQSKAEQEIMLQITDLTGKKVYQMAPKVLAGETTIPVELSPNLPAGVYILTAKTSGQLFTSRLVKQ